jgi:aspartate/methionine/tyrosine aminotransferase
VETRPLATELNEIIERENEVVFSMLSQFGRRIFFPKGILAQSAEATEKAKKFNATIGIAAEGGKPMALNSIMSQFNGLTAAETLTYAPPLGRVDLRNKWKEQLLAKNPSLAGKAISTPAVTGGVTHALSVAGDMFIDSGDMVLVPDKFWENYELLFSVRLQAQMATYPFFNEGDGLNIEGLRQALATRVNAGKTILILNFPNNPTGYSITKAEAEAVVSTLKEAAENGCKLIVISDDAYFGLFYGDDVLQESLFAKIAGLHKNILAIKVDGPTKEEYVWGFRTGMITFGAVADQSVDALYGALEKKLAGTIRSAISNCSHPAQSILVKAMNSPEFASECAEKKAILEARAKKVQQILANPDFANLWDAYPFNAGYFMCVRLKGIDAEAYRKHLLEQYGVGVIADGKHDIRIAFSAVDEDKLEELYSLLAQAAKDLQSK